MLSDARVFAVIPLANAAVRVPELLEEGLYLAALEETGVSVAVCLIIALGYRAANWIMADDAKDETD
jgi:hypothetical protein